MWIIDRPDAHSSSAFNVIVDQEKSVQALLAYTLMSEEEIDFHIKIAMDAPSSKFEMAI